MKGIIPYCLLFSVSGYCQNNNFNNTFNQQNNIIIYSSPTQQDNTPNPDYFPEQTQQEWSNSIKNINPGSNKTVDEILNPDKYRRQEQYRGNPRYYVSKTANLRTGAASTYPIITKMEIYDYVLVIEGVGEWWEIYYIKKDKVGYVHKSLLVSDPSN